jgi:hypothetical protein
VYVLGIGAGMALGGEMQSKLEIKMTWEKKRVIVDSSQLLLLCHKYTLFSHMSNKDHL